jgi:hypothetical protein
MPRQRLYLALAALALAAQAVQAQSANSDTVPTFEAASIKLETPPADGRYAIGPGTKRPSSMPTT